MMSNLHGMYYKHTKIQESAENCRLFQNVICYVIRRIKTLKYTKDERFRAKDE